MKNRINVVQYDAGLQKLASSFHSGNDFLDHFLRDSRSLDDNFGKTEKQGEQYILTVLLLMKSIMGWFKHTLQKVSELICQIYY